LCAFTCAGTVCTRIEVFNGSGTVFHGTVSQFELLLETINFNSSKEELNFDRILLSYRELIENFGEIELKTEVQGQEIRNLR
jgi:hypothetical protein